MPAAHRQDDTGSGHSCHFPPTKATGGSPDVSVNGKPLMRVDDKYQTHGCPTCPAPAHGRKLAQGSGSVYVNGRPAGMQYGSAIQYLRMLPPPTYDVPEYVVKIGEEYAARGGKGD